MSIIAYVLWALLGVILLILVQVVARHCFNVRVAALYDYLSLKFSLLKGKVMTYKSEVLNGTSGIDEARYVQKLRSVIGVSYRFPSGPSKVLDFLFIGCESDSTNFSLLNKLGITHIINCACGYTKTGTNYYGSRVKYMEFKGEDESDYDIMKHFEDVYTFIESARKCGGKVLIHCLMGINRSGVLAIAYIMMHLKVGPITATRMVRKTRCTILTNQSFQLQLIKFAHKKGLLELDKEELPKY